MRTRWGSIQNSLAPAGSMALGVIFFAYGLYLVVKNYDGLSAEGHFAFGGVLLALGTFFVALGDSAFSIAELQSNLLTHLDSTTKHLQYRLLSQSHEHERIDHLLRRIEKRLP